MLATIKLTDGNAQYLKTETGSYTSFPEPILKIILKNQLFSLLLLELRLHMFQSKNCPKTNFPKK